MLVGVVRGQLMVEGESEAASRAGLTSISHKLFHVIGINLLFF